MRIALLQLAPTGHAEKNYQKAKTYIKRAAQNGADIALLPECWNVGYSSAEDYSEGQEEWYKDAITQNDENFKKYIQLAIDSEIAIGLGYLEKDDSKLFNSLAIIDRFGQTLLNYRKVHTVRKNWEINLDAGSEFFVKKLNTKGGIVKIGAMICYDREFPESARILMHKGAEIILVPNASFMDLNRLAQLRSRAYENMLSIATTNYPSPKANGKSSAYDGMRIIGSDYDSQIILADETEDTFYADIDIIKLRDYRSKEIWGDTYRKPWLYGDLIDKDKNDPFIRVNAEKEQ